MVPHRLLRVAGLVGMLALGAAPVRADGVAVLRSSDLAAYEQTVAAFRKAWREPVTEISLAKLDPGQAVERLRAANPEVVVAVGLRAASLVRDRLPRTSMVYCLVPSPGRHDLVGPRITGIAADIPPALELELLHEVAPDVRRIGVLVGRRADPWVREARAAAAKLGLELVVARVEGIERLSPQVRGLLAKSEALWMPADADVATPEAFRFALSEALARRAPFFAFAPALVRAGALAAAAPDLDWVAARLVDAVRRVQNGERAGDVPATSVRRVRLVANLATARALGRELPAAALSDAELIR